MATGSPQADPVSIMRMVLAHKRIGQSPFAQLQDPGEDMIQPQRQNPFVQRFQPQTKPLVPQQAPAPETTNKAPAQEAPKAPAPVVRQASYVQPPGPAPAWQGPMQPTPFQDRLGDVTQAIAQGTFDPSGQNFTTFGPDMHGEGHTPGLRFVDAAAKSAGLDPQKFNYNKQDESFVKGLGGVPVNAENWDTMLENTAPSNNIEDRRGERTWRNKPMEQWNPTDKADYAQASDEEKNAYLSTMIESAMGNRDNYAPEYQNGPISNQEAQR